jgi:hypothetical protein
MASEGYRDFESLDPVETDEHDDDRADWIESEAMNEDGWTVVGEVVRIEQNAGEHNSRLYELQLDLGEYRVFWGRTSIDRQVDSAGISKGDVIGIRNTGDQFESKDGEHTGYVYDVRMLKEDGGD